MKARIAKFLIPSEQNDFHPPALRHQFVIGLGVFLFLLRVFLGSVPAAKSAAVESSTLMNLINSERQRRNLTTLITHSSLVTAAAGKSQDMIDRDYFAHEDPDGNYVWGRIVAAGYTPYSVLGENLAVDFSTSEGMVKAWIDSPSHRANLLHPDFVHQGLSALFGDFNGRYTNLTASLFGRLAATQTATTQSPPPPSPLSKGEGPKPEPYPTPEVAVKPPAQPQTETLPPAAAAPPENQPTSTSESSESPAAPLQTPPPPSSPLSKGEGQNRALQKVANYLEGPNLIRVIFLIFSFVFLSALLVDSVIIYRREIKIARGHASYHLFIFVLLVIVFSLVWFWR